jgi:hypothetical protein
LEGSEDKEQVWVSSLVLYLLLHSTASVARALAGSIGSFVLEGTLGVGAEVLEGVLALVLALLSAAGNALVVGVGGGGTGLGTGLALGLGGLAALVGGRHFCGVLWVEAVLGVRAEFCVDVVRGVGGWMGEVGWEGRTGLCCGLG